MKELDPRLHAYREDLAALPLQDRVRAPRYSEGEIRQVAAPAAPVRVAPRFDAPLATEALSGEILTAYEFREGWAWVQLKEDGYVGYMPIDCLSGMVEENTHRVSARLTYLYPAPDMKRPPITKLSFSCTVAPIGRLEGRFVELSRGGFVFADHLVGIRERAKDYVRVAERFVGVPYLWGGKTTLGIDCSGLVQISLQAAGVPCLRDSDMQMASAGEPLDPSNLEAIQRGDLLFWRGHVAIAQSGDWMIHASGAHMEVVVEPIRRALERTAETHGQLLAILRPNMDKAASVQTAAATPQTQQRKPQPEPHPALALKQEHKPAAGSAGPAAPAPTPAQVPAGAQNPGPVAGGKQPAAKAPAQPPAEAAPPANDGKDSRPG
jgi:cell wall-associated NlpC family hydrolase